MHATCLPYPRAWVQDSHQGCDCVVQVVDCSVLSMCVRFQALGQDIELQSTTVFSIFARFLYVFGASLVVGLTFGLGTAVLLKVLKSNSAPQVS